MTSGLVADLRMTVNDGFDLAVTLTIGHGETVALLGPNGAGKSTTVNALAGFLPIDHGHISLNGRSLDDGAKTFIHPSHRRIGAVFQGGLLFPHLTVQENVAFGLSAGSDLRADVDDWLGALGIRDLADRRPAQLSGGQAQRVALARALACAPDMLMLDEPMSALDIANRASVRAMLDEHLRSFEGPRLLISHDPTDAFLLADRIVIIEDGTVTQVGTADQIRQQPASAWVASFAGTNLLRGVNRTGIVDLAGHELALHTRAADLDGEVIVSISPTAVSLHLDRPSGSPRNVWQTSVAMIEPLGTTARITLSAPIALSVDLTAASVTALGLRSGVTVWASVKATELTVQAAETASTDG